MIVLFLLVGSVFAQVLDVEETCSEDGTLEECADGECVSVGMVDEVIVAAPVAKKSKATKRESTPAPACPAVEKAVVVNGETWVPERPFGDAQIMGGLDKSLIDAVIQRNMSQIRYCYQRELAKHPNLGGKSKVKFRIQKDGSVSDVAMSCSDIDNAEFESCVVGRFQKFQYPEPKGGGIVLITYPFIFTPG